MLPDWAKGKVKKGLAEALNRFEEARTRKIKPFLLENDPEKKISCSLTQLSREIKLRTNLVLVGREPLLYFEFNKTQ